MKLSNIFFLWHEFLSLSYQTLFVYQNTVVLERILYLKILKFYIKYNNILNEYIKSHTLEYEIGLNQPFQIRWIVWILFITYKVCVLCFVCIFFFIYNNLKNIL